MAFSQTLLFTVLPRGCTETGLSLSIFLSPRLDPGTPTGHLHQFALKDWPDQVAAMSLRLKLDGGIEIPAVPRTADLSVRAWNNLFPGDTRVAGYGFRDHSVRKLRSFSVANLRQDIEDLYRQLAREAATAADHPRFGVGNGLDQLVSDLGDLAELVRRHMGQDLAKGEESLLEAIDGHPRKLAYYRAWRFYNSALPPIHSYPERNDHLVPPPPPAKKMDFHEAVASLGDQPTLLRALGLVIDVDAVRPEHMPATGEVMVSSVSPMPGLACTFLRTRYELDPARERFLPRPRSGSDVTAGQLELRDASRFDISQIEVDGAALKLLELATNMKRFLKAPQSTRPTSASLPALQGGGFTISRKERAKRSVKQLKQQKLLHDSLGLAQPLPLDAEDVLRGYRVDVWHQGRWRSLCERTGTVSAGAAGTEVKLPVSDEGYVKASAGRSQPDSAAPTDLYLHEALFGWDGWSLVAQRPGRAVVPKAADVDTPVNPNARHGQIEEVKRVANLPAPGDKLQVSSEIHAKPGSLPRLRYGGKYRFRVRTVDLAGNSLPPILTDDSQASPEQAFLRSEPVPSPVLAPRASYSEGEALEHMVVRSAVGDMLAADLFNAQNERHVLPPKASFNTVELHAMLDPLIAADPAFAYNVAVKEAGTLMDLQIWDPGSGKYLPASGIGLVESPNRTPVDPTGKLPTRKGDPLKSNQYLVYMNDKVRLPYLPDPMAVGYCLWAAGSPMGPSIEPLEALYDGDWLERESSRIVLESGMVAGAQITGAGMRVQLPPATILRLRLASLPSAEDLDKMAWSRDLTDAARELARKGQHWMLTPYRELVLVHAVEKPIEAPRLVKLERLRNLGNTFVDLYGLMDVHGRSTGDVDLRAWWTDRIDDPETQLGLGYTDVHHDGHVRTFKVGYDDTQVDFRRDVARHELGDTKHRFVHYAGRGLTRYREYFPTVEAADITAITRQGPDFAPINVPSSARPVAPHVLYVVPTFRWETGPDSSRRIGRGLRVYLDRPWFSSGEGELLGVVLPGSASGDDLEDIRPYVSAWGRDPVWDSNEPHGELQPSHFANRACTLANLKLAENPEVPVTAVGFAVEFCPERKLWYCDIEMTPQQPYQAFVRLALARLQPDSLPGVHLSTVVSAEFAQLLADRSATLTRGRDGRITVRVAGVTAKNALLLASPDPGFPRSGLAADRADKTEARRASGGSLSPGLQVVPIEHRPVLVKDPIAGHGHVVRAQIESRLKRKQTDPTDLDWATVGASLVLESYRSPVSSTVTWQGELDWAIRDPKHEYRLRLTEHEVFPTDEDIAQPGLPVLSVGPARERLAYLDILPLLP